MSKLYEKPRSASKVRSFPVRVSTMDAEMKFDDIEVYSSVMLNYGDKYYEYGEYCDVCQSAVLVIRAFIQNSGPYCNPNPTVQGLWCSEYCVRVRVTVGTVVLNDWRN